MRIARTVAKAASKQTIVDRSSTPERPARPGSGFRVPVSPDTHRLLSMEQRLSRIEETLATLTRQLAALAAQQPESPTPSTPKQPVAAAIEPPAAIFSPLPVPNTAQRTVEAVLLPDLARAEAGLRTYDSPGRRAAAVFLEGPGGQVWVYDQDGRPIQSEW